MTKSTKQGRPNEPDFELTGPPKSPEGVTYSKMSDEEKAERLIPPTAPKEIGLAAIGSVLLEELEVQRRFDKRIVRRNWASSMWRV